MGFENTFAVVYLWRFRHYLHLNFTRQCVVFRWWQHQSTVHFLRLRRVDEEMGRHIQLLLLVVRAGWVFPRRRIVFLRKAVGWPFHLASPCEHLLFIHQVFSLLSKYLIHLINVVAEHLYEVRVIWVDSTVTPELRTGSSRGLLFLYLNFVLFCLQHY